MTLVETGQDGGRGGSSPSDCNFCTGQQGDPRTRDPSAVLRPGLLRCLNFPTVSNTSLSLLHSPLHPPPDPSQFRYDFPTLLQRP